jgi:hypothetical protein
MSVLVLVCVVCNEVLSREDNPYIGITMNMYSVWILVTKRNASDDGLIQAETCKVSSIYNKNNYTWMYKYWLLSLINIHALCYEVSSVSSKFKY